jgi:predicted O-methyltransferase YrrM
MSLNDIRGFCNFQEIYKNYVNEAQNGSVFVELGSLYGLSTAYMASYIKESGKNITFYAIDYFDLRGISAGEWSQEDYNYVRGLGGIVEDNSMCYNAFIKALTIRELIDYVTPMRLASNDAVNSFQDNSIDFLFIDADHTYEGCKQDIELWLPKVKTGGVIAGHDYDWAGVKQAVDEKFGNRVVKPFTSWIVQN